MANTQDDLVAKASGGYADRVGAANVNTLNTEDLVQQLVDLEGKSVALKEKRDKIESTPALNKLGSLPGILTLLGAGGAAAFGGPGGAQVGLGLLSGAIHGAGEAKVVDENRIAQRIQETQGVLDDQRTRLVTMLQSRPDMFIDPITGKSLVDPRVLGYAATGMLLPIDPGVNYVLTKQTQMRDTMVSTGMNLALQGDTPEKRQQGLHIISSAIGAPFDDAVMTAIEGGDETQMWEAIASSPAFDTRMAVQAWHWALSNGKTLRDPEVISQLTPAAVGRPETAGPKFTLDDAVLSVFQEYQTAIQGIPGVESMSIEERLDYVFGDDVGKADLLKKYFVGSNVFDTGLDGNMVANAVTNTYNQLAQLLVMSPAAGKALGINSPADLPRRSFEIFQSAVPFIQQGAASTAAQDQGYKMRAIEEAIMMKFPDTDPYEATMHAASVLKALRDAATKDGYVDNAAFGRGYDAYIANPVILGSE